MPEEDARRLAAAIRKYDEQRAVQVVGVVPWGKILGRSCFEVPNEESHHHAETHGHDSSSGSWPSPTRSSQRASTASTAARDSPIFTRVPYSVYDEAANIEAEDRRRSLNLTALQPRSDKAPLEPNHTGFIFYGSDEPDGNRWGEETPFRFHLERKLSMLLEVPLILLVIQGGQGTLRAVHAAVASAESGPAQCSILVVEDSEGAAR